MAKVNNIKFLDKSSHFYISKTKNHIIYFTNNKCLKITDSNISFDLLILNSKFSIFDLGHTNFFSFHFMLRCFDEIVIKDLFYWNNLSEKQRAFSDFIKNILHLEIKNITKDYINSKLSCMRTFNQIINNKFIELDTSMFDTFIFKTSGNRLSNLVVSK